METEPPTYPPRFIKSFISQVYLSYNLITILSAAAAAAARIACQNSHFESMHGQFVKAKC